MTEPTPSTDLAVRQQTTPARHNLDREVTDSWVNVMRPIVSLAEHVAETQFVPKAYQRKPDAIAATILHGRELGLPPMTALALTDPIEGKPSIKAEGLRALVLAAGHEIEFGVTTSAQCVIRGRRRGSSTWTEVTWTIDRAKAAGLAGKDVWRKYPNAMLQARASAELCRLVFPDVCHGMGAAEELLDEYEPDDSPQPVPAVEGPKTTVSRARTSKRTQQSTPASSGESSPAAPSTPAPQPLEVDVPMPDAPAPSGPVAAQAPGPEAGDNGSDQLPADLVEAAEQAPERAQPAQVVKIDERKITASQIRMLHTVLGNIGVTDDGEKHDTVEAIVGHQLDQGTTKSLTFAEAKGLLDALVRCQDADDPRAALDELIAERTRGDQS